MPAFLQPQPKRLGTHAELIDAVSMHNARLPAYAAAVYQLHLCGVMQSGSTTMSWTPALRRCRRSAAVYGR